MKEGDLVDGRYRLEGLLGRGGMATVHAATDERLGRRVALKQLASSDEGLRGAERFASETRLLAALAHPGIVRLYDGGVSDGTPWLVMELVDGRGLDQVLADDGPLGLDDLLALAEGLALGLAHAHGHGIVHRDLKPSNVLVDRDGQVRIADFGIARLADEGGLTRTGETLGSPAYLAPEQLAGEEVTGAADVYALGLLLIEAATGGRAFPGTGMESAGARMVRSPAVPDVLEAPLHSLVAAAVRREPAERPSATELVEALADADASADAGGAAEPTRAQPVGATEMVRLPSQRRGAAGPRPARATVGPAADGGAREKGPARWSRTVGALVAVLGVLLVVAVLVTSQGGGEAPAAGGSVELEDALGRLDRAVGR